MDPVVAGLLGTVLGGLFGIAGGILTGRRQAELEREKWAQARADEVAKETRLAVAELTRNMAAATQAMLWFTAKAANSSRKVTQNDISDYDEEIQERLPDILGSLCVVSALDIDISNRMSPLMGEIYSVDAAIAQACKGLETSPERSVETLTELYLTEVSRLHSELVQRVSGITGLTGLGETFSKNVTPDQ